MHLPPPHIALIAGVSRNGVIGRDNQLLWHLPEDLAYFRRTTLGAPVLMGRKTWDSLPARFRPLPGRRNLVLTRQAGWAATGAEPVASVEEAVQRTAGAPVLYVIGGEQVYRAALPLARTLLLTEIEEDFEGDARFPEWDRHAFREAWRERHQAAPPNAFTFSFARYERPGPATAGG